MARSQVGEVKTRSDGKSYRKVAEGQWVQAKTSSTAAQPTGGSQRRSGGVLSLLKGRVGKTEGKPPVAPAEKEEAKKQPPPPPVKSKAAAFGKAKVPPVAPKPSKFRSWAR